MRKIIFCCLILILTFLTDSAFSQENKNKDAHHNIFLELGGMSYVGGSINYEYSFLISNFFRINPGLGIGYEYRSTDMNSDYYISFFLI